MPEVDLTDFNKFMSQLMRILVQQRVQQRGYEAWGDVQRQLQESRLAGQLKAYEASEEMQKRLLEAGYSRDVVKMILGVITQGVEGFGGRPGVEAVRRIREIGLGGVPGVPEEIPGRHEEIMEPYAGLMPALGRRLEAGEYPSEEEMTVMTRILGPARLQEYLKELEKTKIGREKIKVEREKIGLGREKLEAEKKGEIPDKELQKKLDNLYKERDKYVEKYTGIGAPMMVWRPPQQKFIITKLESINKKIKSTEKQLGIESTLPTEEDYKKFEEMAKESIKRGVEINWNAAMMQGFRPSWLLKLREKIGLTK